jgi:hypothetical protein
MSSHPGDAPAEQQPHAVPVSLEVDAGLDTRVSSNPVSSNAQVAIPNQFQDNYITRRIICQWDNSMAGLHAEPQNATWEPLADSLHIFQSKTRYAPNCTPAAERMGNLKQVVLLGMKLKKVESTFPCQLGLTLAGAKGNFYTCNAERYAYLVGANEKSHVLNEVVMATDASANSEYLRMYPGMTGEKLRTDGIIRMPGENFCYVDKQHPVVEMLAENQDVLQINLADAPLMDNRFYKVSSAVTDRCIAELEEHIVKKLPMTDLTKFSATISRLYGREWNDEDEVCDNITGTPLRVRMMATERRLTAVVELTYAYV